MNAKDKILIAAVKLFSKKDFASTSIREIASSAGVNLAMVNYYFKSKDKLLENILNKGVSNLIDETERLMLLDISELEKIELIIDLYCEHIFQNYEMTLIFFQQQMANSNNEIGKMFNDLYSWNIKVFSKLILKGQQNKQLANFVNASLLYATLVGTIQQLVVGNIYLPQNLMAEQSVQTKLNKEEIMAYLQMLARKILDIREACDKHPGLHLAQL